MPNSHNDLYDHKNVKYGFQNTNICKACKSQAVLKGYKNKPQTDQSSICTTKTRKVTFALT